MTPSRHGDKARVDYDEQLHQAWVQRAVFFVLLVIMVLAMAAFRQWAWSSAPLALVLDQEVEVISEGTALVLREERVLVAPVSGTVEWLVTDATRVAARHPVFRILTGVQTAVLREELEATRSRLAELEQARADDAGPERLSVVGRHLQEAVEEARRLVRAGRPVSSDLIGAAASLWAERRSLIKDLSAGEREWLALTQHRQQLADMIDAGSTVVRSPQSGTLIRGMDPLAVMLTRERAAAALPQDVRRWLETAAEPEGGRGAEAGEVAAGTPLGRIVTGWDIYLVTTVPEQTARHLREGAVVRMTVGGTDSRTARGRLTAVGRSDGGERVLIVEAVTGGPLLMDRGTAVPVRMEWDAVRGPRIPRTAVLDDGREGTVVLVRSRRGGVEPRTLAVRWEGEQYLVVDGVAPGEHVLAQPDRLRWISWRLPS
ncbi:MAG: HlyD family efflux transporter periplasmic adaptor subunit [Thermaerobacterales bacterium]